jgi:glucose/arabinose dehydrogenase
VRPARTLSANSGGRIAIGRDGNLFPQWKNSVFVGALRGMFLDRLILSGDKVGGEEPHLVDPHARIRDVRIGPEGTVYALSDDGRLFKLTPK